MHRWDAVAKVRRNDFLLSYVRQEFIAIGQATSEPVVRPRPLGNISGGSTVMNGFGVDVEYTLLEPRIKLTDIPRDVLTGLTRSKGPQNRKLMGNQGYLFSIPSHSASALLQTMKSITGHDFLGNF